jgi:hypothetical protein
MLAERHHASHGSAAGARKRRHHRHHRRPTLRRLLAVHRTLHRVSMERDQRNEIAGRGLQVLEFGAVTAAVLMLLLFILLKVNSGQEINVSVPQKVDIKQLPAWR